MLDIRDDKTGLILVDGSTNEAVFIRAELKNRLRFFIAGAPCNIGYTQELEYLKVESTRQGVYIGDDKERVYIEPNDMYRILNLLGGETQESLIANAVEIMEEELGSSAMLTDFLSELTKVAEEKVCQPE